jgi:osmoprotectant transport system permease protein
VVVSAALLLTGLVWLAGAEAARQSGTSASLTRVSLGGGFWTVVLFIWLMAADALQRLGMSLAQRAVAHTAVLLPSFVLLGAGALDHLSLLKEYANRDDVFRAAGLRHLQIVAATLLPSLLIGVPMGVAAARSERLATPLFAVLNVIQTVPSIALFALLIAPLSSLAVVLPGWGIRGIGLLPAVIALTLYALLPIVHGTTSGLRQVPAAAVTAATGMGMTVRQVFWRVEVPLALPVLLSALRVTTVQIVGLAVVAALIGAGGFGALVFQGLASSALDLVMLGVLPVVALAIVADASLELLTAALRGPQP